MKGTEKKATGVEQWFWPLFEENDKIAKKREMSVFRLFFLYNINDTKHVFTNLNYALTQNISAQPTPKPHMVYIGVGYSFFIFF